MTEDGVSEARQRLLAARSVDTLENEQRLTLAVADLGGRLERTRGRNPQRYRLVVQNGALQPLTLLDVEEWVRHLTTAQT